MTRTQNDKIQTECRPDIATITSADQLKRWYWLKAELTAQAKSIGVKSTGAKFTLLERIAHYIDTGETNWPGDTKVIARSKFDWHSAPLNNGTIITDSYKNTQNMRRFFTANAAEDFKFTIALMDWMKTNTGKTLGDAVQAYQTLRKATADPNHKTDIKSHNQFNQYTRDFLADNPDMGMKDVRKFWALKRALPTEDGRHVYEPGDLDL